jgi:hypothetical protein
VLRRSGLHRRRQLARTHRGTSVVVIDRVGGSADNLVQTFTVAGFSGRMLGGAWALKVGLGGRRHLQELNVRRPHELAGCEGARLSADSSWALERG